MNYLKNILTRSKPTKINPSSSTENAPPVERRKFPRLEIPKGIPLKTEYISQDDILFEARCINVSSEGALIEFHEDSYPKAEEGEKGVLHLRLAGEEVQLPAIVMSRQKNQIALFLPSDMISQIQDQDEAYFRILRTLDRAILRRKTR
jgi:PilZ domain